MDEQTFRRAADAALEQLVDALDAVDLGDADVDLGDGKLEIELEDGTKLIVSRQAATRQLWLAEPGGGWHYDAADGGWVCDKRGVELRASLEALLSAKLGRPISLVS